MTGFRGASPRSHVGHGPADGVGMLPWRPLIWTLFLSAVLGISSCSAPAVDVVEPTSTDVVQSLLEQGYSLDVSSCVAGLGETTDTPKTQQDLIDACERASSLLHEPATPPSTLPMAGPSAYGDDPVLDALWDACAEGEGTACDELWESSPVGSDYEEFGVTCGDRPAVLNCAELTEGEPALAG